VVDDVLSVRLPLYPGLKIELCSDFVPELIGNLLTGALDLALVNGPPRDNQITAVSLSREPLTAVLPERHSASSKSHLRLADLANDSWITFQPRANPVIHQAILSTAKHESVRPKRLQYVMTPQEVFDSVAEGLGVAVIPRFAISRYRLAGMTVHALSEAALSFETALLLRAENDSRLTNEFARAFLKKLRVINATPRQLELPIAG
jgi:DNA-binding transcriptional LysR family regulator